MRSTLAGAAAAALFALAPAAGLAQNETVQANVTTTTSSPPAAEPRTPAPPPPPPATDPGIPPVTGTDTVITTTTTTAPPPVDMTLPPMEPVNPYANSYNELEPLMVEEDRGFDDWGLFGLLGLLGLLGLMRRRERIVYVEREETRVYRAPGDTLPPR
jgi:hypothetical protein